MKAKELVADLLQSEKPQRPVSIRSKEVEMRYGGCISTTNWTDKRVYKERLTFILDVAQLCNRLVHVIQQVASGSLYPSLPQCKETKASSLKRTELPGQ